MSSRNTLARGHQARRIPLTARLAATVLAVAALVACARNAPSGAAKAEDCEPFIAATGKQQRISHPQQPSACLGVVLMCNYCEYRPDGTFEKAGSEPCGGCIGADF
jgi:hypothetical protein